MAEGLVAVATFSRHLDAELAKSKLEAEGLRAFLADGNIVRLNWFLSGAVGGVKLLVREMDEARAATILNEDPRHAQAALREVFGDDPEELCIRCGSDEVRGQGSSAFRSSIALVLVALLLAQPFVLLLIGVPVLFYRRRRRCFECGLRWREPA